MPCRPALALFFTMSLLLAGCAGGSSTAEEPSTPGAGGAATAAADDRSTAAGDEGDGADEADGAGEADEADEETALRIAVTTSILGDVVAQLVRDDGQVDVIMPRGADPHSFRPSASTVATMREADLLVVNGAAAEEAMLDVIEATREDGVPTFEAISAVDTIEFDHGDGDDDHGHDDEGDDHSDADDDHGHDGEGDDHSDSDDDHRDDDHRDDDHSDDDHGHEGDDPHFWLDPTRMADAVTALATAIAEVDDALSDEEWAARGEALAEDLRSLDTEIEEILSVVPDERRILVTNHEAFGYFADRYDFTILGTVIPGGSTLSEPSASGLESLVAAIEEAGVPAIFTENINPSALAEAVAAEAGTPVEVALLYSDSLSEDEEAGTYADYLRANARTIADALTAG